MTVPRRPSMLFRRISHFYYYYFYYYQYYYCYFCFRTLVQFPTSSLLKMGQINYSAELFFANLDGGGLLLLLLLLQLEN